MGENFLKEFLVLGCIIFVNEAQVMEYLVELFGVFEHVFIEQFKVTLIKIVGYYLHTSEVNNPEFSFWGDNEISGVRIRMKRM